MIWQSAHSMTWIRNEPNFLHLHVSAWSKERTSLVSQPFWGFLFLMSHFCLFFFRCIFQHKWTWHELGLHARWDVSRITHLWAIAEGDSPTHQKKATEIPLEVLDQHVNLLSTSQPSQIFQSTERPEISKSKTLISAAWMMDMSKLFCVSGMLDYFIMFDSLSWNSKLYCNNLQ